MKPCTAMEAKWCPNHGDCSCEVVEGYGWLVDESCPLHGPESDHPRPLSARDVLDALARHWPPATYVSIAEAPVGADRQGGKLDLLVMSLWRSRGFERDGVEIKVSLSDWRRELDDAGKADWWWGHVHRFWVAVPAKIADKVRSELPTGWGLLVCTRSGVKIVVKPTKHEAKPLPESTYLGLMRAASGAGFNALQRARDAGYAAGDQAGRARAERETGDYRLRKELEDLRAAVGRFETSSGVSLQDKWSLGDIGAVVALVAKVLVSPASAARDLKQQADKAAGTAKALAEVAAALEALFKPEAVSA